MTRPLALWMLLAAVLMAALPTALPAAAADNERAELKERFRERFPTLVMLKRTEKIGETYKGLAAAVRKEHLDTPADPKDPKGQTVRAFLEAENRDRERLYKLIAEDTGATPDVVAARDAERRFRQARPHEFLQVREDTWVRKRDL